MILCTITNPSLLRFFYAPTWCIENMNSNTHCMYILPCAYGVEALPATATCCPCGGNSQKHVKSSENLNLPKKVNTIIRVSCCTATHEDLPVPTAYRPQRTRAKGAKSSGRAHRTIHRLLLQQHTAVVVPGFLFSPFMLCWCIF